MLILALPRGRVEPGANREGDLVVEARAVRLGAAVVQHSYHRLARRAGTSSVVAVGWAGYVVSLLGDFGIVIPVQLTGPTGHAVMQTVGNAMVPAAHIWTSSQLAWLHLGDDLPRHAGEDPGERDVEP